MPIETIKEEADFVGCVLLRIEPVFGKFFGKVLITQPVVEQVLHDGNCLVGPIQRLE